MFFKKRREAAKAKAADARQQVLEVLQKQFDDALVIADPAEKLAKLDETRIAVMMMTEETKKIARAQSSNKMYVPYLSIAGGTLTAAAAASIALALSPALMALAVPAAIIGLVVGDRRSKKSQAAADAVLAPFYAALDEKKNTIAAASDKIVQENIVDIAASPRFAELQSLPGLRDSFMKALQQKVTAPEQKPQPKKPDGPGFRI